MIIALEFSILHCIFKQLRFRTSADTNALTATSSFHRIPRASRQLSAYWDRMFSQIRQHPYYDAILGSYKAGCMLEYIHSVVQHNTGIRILKTDLFEEAMEVDQILPGLIDGLSSIIGIDISDNVTRTSALRFQSETNHVSFLTADSRFLPLKANSFDIVISPSTFDHFEDFQSFESSIAESARVLRASGTMVLILDNPGYLFRSLLKLKSAMHITPAYIGKTYHESQLNTILRKHDLRALSCAYLMHAPVNTIPRLFRILNALFGNHMVKLYRRIDHFSQHAWWGSFTGSYLAITAIKEIR